ncbi:BZ3500_MvSof-1268-A1-R1_Chr3-1g05967 [Microbotryum saponariae]|uniref:BZ3500_MvSof-1268-A1-R1_Chr3-1g05967 protein n=1 Tax=Microbotryum saponariae TaxID=289078 RepID=A0A2X0NIQ6_9BASI|nr:BZ3500_MvSof-1268-A1-R1_Chr3-1g05967 [Microbotryum saponariae]SDA05157.1 BZ3501_MvSof-1269-A2-R1_Chr3-1g05637 [Microbotryum saponariae]
MSSDHALLSPAEVDALPTPHAPGFWPETPAADAYLQNEGPLEQAGRSMGPLHSEESTEEPMPAEHNLLAPAILATGAGLLLGGPVAGVVAGLAAGVAGLERQGLKKGLAHTDTPNEQLGTSQSQDVTPKGSPSSKHTATLVPAEPSPSGSTSTQVPEDLTEQKTQAALAASPAQQMLGGEDAHQDLSALVAGAAGTAVVDKEIEEPTTELKEETRDRAVSNAVPDPAWKSNLISTGVQTEESAPSTPTKEEGLSSSEKAALGAGAGLGAAGLAAAAAHEHEHHDAFTDSVRPDLATTSEPLTLNEQTPSTVAATPSSEATAQDVKDAEAEDSEKAKEGWTDKEKLAAGAGAVGAGGLAAAAISHEAKQHEKMPIQPVQPVQEPTYAASSSPAQSSSSAQPVQHLSTPATVASNPSSSQETSREIREDSLTAEEPKEGLSDKEKAALGAGAAGVAAGGLATAAVKDHETASSSPPQGPPPASALPPLAPVKDSTSTGVASVEGPATGFSAQQDGDAVVSSAPLPVADPADPPVGSYVIPKVMDEDRDAATPGKITVLSDEDRTAERKADAAQDGEPKEDRTKDDSHKTELAAAGAALGGVGAIGAYEALKPEHRQVKSRFSDTTLGSNMAPTVHSYEEGHGTFEEQRYVAHDPSLGQDFSHDKVDPASLVTPAAATVPGFAGESSAREDFAHLSQQPEEVASQEEDRRGWTTGEKIGAGAVGAGGIGLGAAALAHHNARLGEQGAPILTTNNSLQRVLNESSLPGAESSSKPSSTRAMKGSPVGTPGVQERAMTPESPSFPRQAAVVGAGAAAGAVAADQYYHPQQGEHPQQVGNPQQSGYPQQGGYPQEGDYRQQAEADRYRQQGDYYSDSPRGDLSAGSGSPVDRRSGDAQRLQFQDQYPEGVHPVEKSPHMRIATHVDGTGRKKLHRKSLGDVFAPGEGTQFPVQTSPRNASPRVGDGEQGFGGYDDRRDSVMDRVVGIHDPASPSRTSGEHGRTHSKLSKNRRPSRGAGEDSPDGTASPKKSGFFSKMFSGK